jgi:hypothetical protein
MENLEKNIGFVDSCKDTVNVVLENKNIRMVRHLDSVGPGRDDQEVKEAMVEITNNDVLKNIDNVDFGPPAILYELTENGIPSYSASYNIPGKERLGSFRYGNLELKQLPGINAKIGANIYLIELNGQEPELVIGLYSRPVEDFFEDENY